MQNSLVAIKKSFGGFSMRKILCLFLCFILAFSTLVVSAESEDDDSAVVYFGDKFVNAKVGDVVTVTLRASTGELALNGVVWGLNLADGIELVKTESNEYSVIYHGKESNDFFMTDSFIPDKNSYVMSFVTTNTYLSKDVLDNDVVLSVDLKIINPGTYHLTQISERFNLHAVNKDFNGRLTEDDGYYKLVEKGVVHNNAKNLGFSFSEEISVSEECIAISMKTLPDKIRYIKNKEELDLTGATLALTMVNGTEKVIDITADMVSGFNNSARGYNNITVNYGGLKTNFVVRIVQEILPGEFDIEAYDDLCQLTVEAYDYLDKGYIPAQLEALELLIEISESLQSEIDNNYSIVEEDVDEANETVQTMIDAFNTVFAALTYLPGDVDHSGAVDSTDATLVLQRFAGIIDDNYDGYYSEQADTDESGTVDSTDATIILQLFAGILYFDFGE